MISHSPPGELSAFKLSKCVGKDFETVTTYLHYLHEAGLVRFLYPKASGKAYLRNPEKMYPDNTNLMYAAYISVAQDNILGKARETFAVNHLQNAGYKVFCSSKGDIAVSDFVFEIGGRNKKEAQIRGEKNGYILRDGCLTGTSTVIPLYLLGFVY